MVITLNKPHPLSAALLLLTLATTQAVYASERAGAEQNTPVVQRSMVNAQWSTSVERAEYFWDADPGFGLGTPLESDIVPTDGLAPGEHLLFMRYRGTCGWSPTFCSTVVVPKAETPEVLTAEYFWDTDPGFGLGTPLESNVVPTTGLTPGEHQFFVRYLGTDGWSPTCCSTVVVPRDETPKILAAEYFWNEDPGFGQGTPIDLVPGETVSLDDFGVPSFTVHGDATLFIRYRGLQGWSPTISQVVMVDAEGHYTLNANAETSMDQRNYQTLGDAFADFCDRGIGNNIELEIKTKNSRYEFDATADTLLEQIQQMADNLERLSTQQEPKLIAFTATDGAADTVSIAAPSLHAVMPLLGRVRTENVVLLVNGTEYCFNALTQRHQTVCPGEPTAPVSLEDMGGTLTATFTAQPHEATVLSGYAAESTGTLPAMTLTNAGAATDSLAYTVTLSQQGTEVYAYTYYIYTRASMLAQHFSGLTPAAAASLDPGTVTLRWNALKEVDGGYRLVITERPVGSDIVADTTTVDLTATSYALTAKSGYHYTWQVTAYGPCDELQSAVMTFEGRLLPDLVVNDFTLPEAAQAGNLLTVEATIVNQGEGATTEQTWTDRLYYIIDGTDFAQATQIAEQQHTGNLAPGERYTASFTVKVPAVESGMIRFFVATDVKTKVMEANDDNNRTLSKNAATLSPFYMATADLTSLRQLYADFDGANWSGSQWDTTSELITDKNWSGVSFDTDGHVTAINLQARGLSGSLTAAVPSVATLSQLTSLNLSQNALTGDPALYLAGAGTLLTTVDLSYNQIDVLSAPLPETVTTLSIGYQHRKYKASTTYPGFDGLASRVLNIGNDMTVDLPALFGYDHKAQDFTQHPNLNVYTPDQKTRYGTLSWSKTNDCYVYQSYNWKQTEQQDEDVLLVCVDGTTLAGSVLPASMHLTTGDVNLTGFVDVNDVQRTLNYVINQNNTTTFSLWAANTFAENEPADLINIQDIVTTVNIVLSNQGAPAGARRAADNSDGHMATAARFYADGRYICIDADAEVAAFCLDLHGVTPDQVRLLLSGADWQISTLGTVEGVRLLVFSPTGQTLSVGTQQLLRVSGNATPASASATDAMAEPLSVAVGTGQATGITNNNPETTNNNRYYDLQGRKLTNDESGLRRLGKGIYIMNGKKMKR